MVATEEGVDAAFASVLATLRNNNPILFFSGLSTEGQYKSHIVVIAGFCYLQDGCGREQLWLLIADPAGTGDAKKVNALHKPIGGESWTKEQDDCAHLNELHRDKNDFIKLFAGDWYWGRAGLYLMRARSLFLRKEVRRDLDCLLMDYTHYDGSPNAGGCYRHLSGVSPYRPAVVESSFHDSTSFPMQGSANGFEGPPLHYFSTETANSGYFPVGVMRALHGGIHLPAPTDEDRLVRCCAPGHIVAARLSFEEPEEAAAREKYKKQLNFFNGPLGFVLVEHRLMLKKKTADGFDEVPLTFYSLYMHLTPTGASKGEKPDGACAWLSRLYQARFGSITNLDPDPKSGVLGELAWANEPLDNVDKEELCAIQPERAGQGSKKRLRANGRYLGYGRPPPVDLAEAYRQLVKEKKAVTFVDPIFPVAHGEVLGFARQTEGSGGVAMGALHWELLCPAEKSAIDELLKVFDEVCSDLGVQLPENLVKVTEKEGQKDNFITREEFKELFAGKLPKSAGEPFKEYLESGDVEEAEDDLGRTDLFARFLRPYLRTPKTFEPPFEPASESDEKTPKDPGPDGTVAAKYYGHPVKLKIDNPLNLDSLSIGGKWFGRKSPFEEIERKAPMGHFKLTLSGMAKTPSKEIVVRAPVGAELLELKCDAAHVDEAKPGTEDELKTRRKNDLSLFAALVGQRWRNIHLKRINEWTEAGLAQFIRHLDDETEATKRRAKKLKADEGALKEAMWWGSQAMVIDSDPDTPLFGSSLPSAAEIENLHPVTMLWLLKLLEANERIRFVAGPERKKDGSQENPALFWTWVLSDGSQARMGENVPVVAIGTKHGSGPVELAVEEDRGNLLWARRATFDANGVTHDRFPIYGWGTMTLLANDSDAPTEQGGTTPTLKIPQPVLKGDTVDLVQDPKTGVFHFDVAFDDHCPAAVVAAVEFETVEVDKPGAGSSVEGSVFWQSWLRSPDGALIVGARDPAGQLTKSFSFGAFKKVMEDGGTGIAPGLCVAAQALFTALGGMEPVSVNQDGTEAVLVAAGENGRRLLSRAGSDADAKATIEKVLDGLVASFEVVTHGAGKRANALKVTVAKPAPVSPKPSKVFIPVRGAPSAQVAALTTDADGFYIGSADKNLDVRVTKNFTLREYTKVAAGSFKLHPSLAMEVQELRRRYDSGLSLTLLKPSGLEVELVAGTWPGDAEKLRRLADDMGTFESVTLTTKKVGQVEVADRLVLKVAVPSARSGVCRFEFAPQEAFFHLTASASDDKLVLVAAKVVIPKWWTGMEDEGVALNSAALKSDEATLKYATDEDQQLALTSGGFFATVANAHLGEDLTVEMEGTSIKATVPLFGDLTGWKKAGLVLVVTAGDKTLTLHGSIVGQTFVATVPLFAKDVVDQELKLEVKTTEPARFFGQPITVAPVRWSGSLKATPLVEKDSFTGAIHGDVLHLEARLVAFPTAGSLGWMRIYCFRRKKGDEQAVFAPDLRLQKALRYARGAHTSSGLPVGLSDGQGALSAEVDLSLLSAEMEYQFVLRRPVGRTDTLEQALDKDSSLLETESKKFVIEPQSVTVDDIPQR